MEISQPGQPFELSIGTEIVGGTDGSVLFVGPGSALSQDNSNFFWDDTNNRLGLGTTTPDKNLTIYGGLGAGMSFYNSYAPGRANYFLAAGITGYSHNSLALYENYDSSDIYHLTTFQGSLFLGGRDNVTSNASVTVLNGQLKSEILRVSATSPFVILSGGNVGIGTTNPAEMLTLGDGGKIKLVDAAGTYGTAIYNNSYTFTVAGSGAYGPASLDILDMITLSTGYAMRGADNAFKFNKSIYAAHNGSYGFETYGSTPSYAAISALYTDNNTSGLAINSRTGGVDTERIRIESGGNVGVGTGSPLAPLDVRNTLLLPGSTQLVLGGPTSGAMTKYSMLFNDVNQNDLTYRTYRDHIFQTDTGDGTAGTNRLVIKGSTGYVGIGTTAPSSLLDVRGIPSSGAPVIGGRSTVDTVSATVEFYSHTGSPIFTLTQHPSTAASGIITNVTNINGLSTISLSSGGALGSSSSALNINSGNVLIGYNASTFVGYFYTELAASLSFGTNTVERLSIGTTGGVTINGFTSSTVGLTVKGASSQSANLQEWQNVSGTALTYINSSGAIFLPDGTLGNPAYSFTSATNTGLYWDGTSLNISISASRVSYISSSDASFPAVTVAGRSRLKSATDGNFTISNNADTSFSLLQLGGTTSSFPAIKRSSATVEIRLADDSAYADISASQGTFSSYILRSSQTGIAASTTQTQGQGALTKDINIVSTVANANDTCTLPSAVAGMRIFIRNNGANTMQIFPASGDNINGTGVNTAVTLASGSSVTYQTADTTNWYS